MSKALYFKARSKRSWEIPKSWPQAIKVCAFKLVWKIYRRLSFIYLKTQKATRLGSGFEKLVRLLGLPGSVRTSNITSSALWNLGLEGPDVTSKAQFLQKRPRFFAIDIMMDVQEPYSNYPNNLTKLQDLELFKL